MDCADHGTRAATGEQPQYNLFHRERVGGSITLFQDPYSLGTTIWSPLCAAS